MYSTALDNPVIVLSPRPWEPAAGKLALVPLLATKSSVPSLPMEIWERILSCTISLPSHRNNDTKAVCGSLLLVCKAFKSIVEPHFYLSPPVPTLSTLSRLVEHLRQSETRPIGLNRIPYSAPGRWIQKLDFSDVQSTTPGQLLQLDNAMSALFPMTPFLTTLILGEHVCLSSRALMTLTESDCVGSLRDVLGLQTPLPYVFFRDEQQLFEDPIIRLLSKAISLRRVSLRGPSHIDEVSQLTHLVQPLRVPTVSLPHLHHLLIRGLFASGVVMALAQADLPSLRSLSLTRSDFLPASCTFLPILMQNHCTKVQSLHFFPPAAAYSSQLLSIPDDSLIQFPNLKHLTVSGICTITPPRASHPLISLTIPRPTANLLEEIQLLIALLPSLRLIQFSEVRWLPTKMNAHARASGVPGEMGKWKRRLGMRRIVILDADGKSEQ